MSAATKKSKTILEKSGWKEGQGLGRNEHGEVEHVKVQQKDGMLGIGYNAGVQQVWSVQSVEFADVLARINGSDGKGGDAKADNGDDDDDDDDGKPLQRQSNLGTGGRPAAGKYGASYNKRRNLKTEGLTSAAGKAEIIAHAKRRQRGDEEGSNSASSSSSSSSDDDDNAASKKVGKKQAASNLVSPLLKRLCERGVTMEPEKRNPEDAVVTIKMPEPKPPRCTETPFQYQRE
jgi:Pin2-interacting protein X1